MVIQYHIKVISISIICNVFSILPAPKTESSRVGCVYNDCLLETFLKLLYTYYDVVFIF